MKWKQVGRRRWRSGDWVIEHKGYGHWDIEHCGQVVGQQRNPVDARHYAADGQARIEAELAEE